MRLMPRYVAFLRAINVGGHHKVTMDQLRRTFEALRPEQRAALLAFLRSL